MRNWYRTAILGVFALVTLPVMCLAGPGPGPRAGQITWPVTDNLRHPGAPKNRKGLRHSPGVLMDVMRTPTSVKAVTGVNWKINDQLVAYSGGYPPRWHQVPPQKPRIKNKPYVQSPASASSTNHYVYRKDPRRKPHSIYKETTGPGKVLHPWVTSAQTLNFAPPYSAWQIRPHIMDPVELVAVTQPPETPPPEPPLETPLETNLVVTTIEDAVKHHIPTGTNAPASFQAPGAARKARQHVRIFSNAHQYKREQDMVSTTAVPPTEAAAASYDSKVSVDPRCAPDDVSPDSSWFRGLLGRVIAAAESSASEKPVKE